MRTYPGYHVVVSVWLILAWATPLVGQNENPVVSFPYGTQVEISAAGTEDTRWIPVRLAADVDVGDLQPTLRDVKRGDVRAGFEDAFTVQAVSRDDSTGPGIAVTVSLDPPLEPGTYTLHLEVPAIGDTTAVEQALQVVVPDAKVQVLGTLAITRVDTLVTEGELYGSRLRLRETGDRSRLKPWTLVQLEATGPDREPVTARLDLPSPPELNTGVSEQIVELGSQGEFPLGETKGKLEIDGPQLAAPVTIDFEYVRRLHPLWLLAPVLLGLLLGYVIRVWLARRTERLELQSKAHAFFARVAKERGRYKDSALHTRLDEIEAKVRRHLEDSDKLPDQLTTAQAELKTALEKWAQRQAEQKGRLIDLTNLLGLAWQIPRSMRESLRAEKVAEGLKSAAAALDETNTAKAEELLDEVDKGLKQDLRFAANEWTDRLSEKLGTLELEEAPLITEALQWADSRLSATKSAIQAVPVDDPDPEVEALLSKSHEASVELGHLVEALDLRMRTRLGGLLETLGSLSLPDPEIVEELARQAQAFFESREEGESSPDPETRLSWILDEGPEIDGLLGEAMVSQVKEDDREELAKKLRSGKFDEAAQFLRDHLKAGVPLRTAIHDEGALLGGADRLPEMSPLGAGTARAAPASFQAWWDRWFGSEVVEVGETVEAQRLRTTRELFGLKLVQFLFAAFLIVLASYFVFVDTYVGTLSQNIALFFWAFALDLSVDGAVSLGNKLQPKDA